MTDTDQQSPNSNRIEKIQFDVKPNEEFDVDAFRESLGELSGRVLTTVSVARSGDESVDVTDPGSDSLQRIVDAIEQSQQELATFAERTGAYAARWISPQGITHERHLVHRAHIDEVVREPHFKELDETPQRKVTSRHCSSRRRF